ncbi:hypothetical protein GCM10020000_01530 [Streptomyces olivoverticillatus]
MSSPHILMTGDRLALGMPRDEALAEYHKWETDTGTILGYGSRFPQTWEAHADEWEEQGNDPNTARFEIVRIKDKQPIGLSTLYLNPVVRSARFLLVLAPAHRGKRYAEEATRLTLDWAFHLGGAALGVAEGAGAQPRGGSPPSRRPDSGASAVSASPATGWGSASTSC